MPENTAHEPSSSTIPPELSYANIRAKVEEKFQKRPCRWQCQVAQSVLQGKDVIIDVGTGMGKTLAFFVPILFRPRHIQIIVTALNVLGKQNVEQLERAGISAISIASDTATHENFRAIEDGKHQVVVVSPEQIMKPGGGFEKLFKKPEFTSRIISVVFDEAHCITQWGSFRPEYRELSRLRYLIPKVPFVLASATFSYSILKDVKELLRIRNDNLKHIRRSNERPNIRIGIKKIKHSLDSFQDLAFLIPEDWKEGDEAPMKFVVFFDNIREAVYAGKFLRRRLPLEYRNKVKWFHADMSVRYKEETMEKLRTGEIWGLCATDSFGMGVDLPDIVIVIQWRMSCSMCTLWQRLGRAVRNLGLKGVGLVFVENKHLDEQKKPPDEKNKPKKRKGPISKIGTDSAMQSHGVAGDSTNNQNVPTTSSQIEDNPADPTSELLGPHADALPAAQTPEEREESIRELYMEAQKGAQTKALVRKKAQELDPELQDLVNAQTRGLGCRRVPLKLYFNSDKAETDHLQCDTSMPDGCPRCCTGLPDPCCDIHHPELFAIYTSMAPPRPPARRRSNLDKYTRGRPDYDLLDALEEWRDNTAASTFSEGIVLDLGGCVILPDETLERIVDCAHFGKLITLEDLKRETRWIDAVKYGTAILCLVKEHAPTPPQPQVGQIASSSGDHIGTPGASKTQKPVSRQGTPKRCTACGLAGHNRSNKRECARHRDFIGHTRASENIPPTRTPPSAMPAITPPPSMSTRSIPPPPSSPSFIFYAPQVPPSAPAHSDIRSTTIPAPSRFTFAEETRPST